MTLILWFQSHLEKRSSVGGRLSIVQNIMVDMSLVKLLQCGSEPHEQVHEPKLTCGSGPKRAMVHHI